MDVLREISIIRIVVSSAEEKMQRAYRFQLDTDDQYRAIQEIAEAVVTAETTTRYCLKSLLQLSYSAYSVLIVNTLNDLIKYQKQINDIGKEVIASLTVTPRIKGVIVHGTYTDDKITSAMQLRNIFPDIVDHGHVLSMPLTIPKQTQRM